MANDLLLPTPILDILMFIYPAYCSVAALKDNDRQKIIQFMTYWLVFGAFVTTESILYFFLRFVPLYTAARRALCVWCILPIPSNGGEIIYHQVIEEMFSHMTDDINELSQLSLERVRRMSRELRNKVTGRRGRPAGEAGASSPSNPSQAADANASAYSGLEQMRDKAEDYREKLMDQLRRSLSSARPPSPQSAALSTEQPNSEDEREPLALKGYPGLVTARALAAAAAVVAGSHLQRRGLQRAGSACFADDADDGGTSGADSTTGEDVTWN